MSTPELPDIDSLSSRPDKEIDLARAALALAGLLHDDKEPGRYLNHIEKLIRETAARHKKLLEAGAEDDAGACLAALKHVLADTHGYKGDNSPEKVLETADLYRVIDTGTGHGAALCVLYTHVARRQGWAVQALAVPKRFLCRLDKGGERLIFDPSKNCQPMDAVDLRVLIKKALGEKAELSASYFDPLSNRALLIRLHNLIKFRLIEGGEYKAALDTVWALRHLAPEEIRLMLEAGILLSRLQNDTAAIGMLQAYLEKAPPGPDRQEASLLLRELQAKLL